MFDSISFAISRKTICLYGREFLLGTLSTQVLNISHHQIMELYHLLKQGQSFCEQYENTEDVSILDQARIRYQELEYLLRQHPMLALLLDADCLLPKIPDVYHDWYPYIAACFSHAGDVLDSIQTFHDLVGHFIKSFILSPQSLTAGNLATLIRNGDLHRMNSPDSPIELTFDMTAETLGNKDFQILEQYRTGSLLMLLKIDFYKALEARHLIRRCEYCGRFFLLPKRLHTKYCDNPAPDHPQYTCAQMGYRLTRRKENTEDDPKADALRRCLNRITKDCSRGIITAEEKESLKVTAEELYHAARIRSGVTYEAFEESLKSQNLYPLCGVIRNSRPVGHPKKETIRS